MKHDKNKKIVSEIDKSFGIWKNRKDIKNNGKWVADLRKEMSTRAFTISSSKQ